MVRLAGVAAANVGPEADGAALAQDREGDAHQTVEAQESRLRQAYLRALEQASQGDQAAAVSILEEVLRHPLFAAASGLGGDNEQLQGPRLYEALLQAALLQQGKPRQLKALHAEIYGAAASNLAGLLPASQAHEAAQLYSTALFSHDDQANDALVWGRLGVCAARCRSLGLARFALEQAIRRARDHIPLQEHAMEVAWLAGDYQGSLDIATHITRVDAHHPTANRVLRAQRDAQAADLTSLLNSALLGPQPGSSEISAEAVRDRLHSVVTDLLLDPQRTAERAKEPFFPLGDDAYPGGATLSPFNGASGDADVASQSSGSARPPVLLLSSGKTVAHLLKALLQGISGEVQLGSDMDPDGAYTVPRTHVAQLVVLCAPVQAPPASPIPRTQPGFAAASNNPAPADRQQTQPPDAAAAAGPSQVPLSPAVQALARGRTASIASQDTLPVVNDNGHSDKENQDMQGTDIEEGEGPTQATQGVCQTQVQPAEDGDGVGATQQPATQGASALANRPPRAVNAGRAQGPQRNKRKLQETLDAAAAPAAGDAAAGTQAAQPDGEGRALRARTAAQAPADAAATQNADPAMSQGPAALYRTLRAQLPESALTLTREGSQQPPAASQPRPSQASPSRSKALALAVPIGPLLQSLAGVLWTDKELPSKPHVFTQWPPEVEPESQQALALLEAPAGTQPELPAGTQPEPQQALAPADVPAGTQAKIPAGTQAEAPAGTQPQGPAATQAEALAGTQAELPAGTQVELPQDAQPEGHQSTHPQAAPPAQAEAPHATQPDVPQAAQVPASPSPAPAVSALSRDILLSAAGVAPTTLSALARSVVRRLLGQVAKLPGSCVTLLLDLQSGLGPQGWTQEELLLLAELHTAAAVQEAMQLSAAAMKEAAAAAPRKSGAKGGGAAEKGRPRRQAAAAAADADGDAAVGNADAQQAADAAPAGQDGAAAPAKALTSPTLEHHLQAADRLAGELFALNLTSAHTLTLRATKLAIAPEQPESEDGMDMVLTQVSVPMREPPQQREQQALRMLWVWAHIAELKHDAEDAVQLYTQCSSMLSDMASDGDEGMSQPSAAGLQVCTPAAVRTKLRSLRLLQLLESVERALRAADAQAPARVSPTKLRRLVALAFPAVAADAVTQGHDEGVANADAAAGSEEDREDGEGLADTPAVRALRERALRCLEKLSEAAPNDPTMHTLRLACCFYRANNTIEATMSAFSPRHLSTLLKPKAVLVQLRSLLEQQPPAAAGPAAAAAPVTESPATAARVAPGVAEAAAAAACEAVLQLGLTEFDSRLIEYLHTLHTNSPTTAIGEGAVVAHNRQTNLVQSHAVLSEAVQLLLLLRSMRPATAEAQMQAAQQPLSQLLLSPSHRVDTRLPEALRSQPALLATWCLSLELLGSRLSITEAQELLKKCYSELRTAITATHTAVGGPDAAAAILLGLTDDGHNSDNDSDNEQDAPAADAAARAAAGTPTPRTAAAAQAPRQGSIDMDGDGVLSQPRESSAALNAHVRALYGALGQVLYLMTGIRFDWRDVAFGNEHGTSMFAPTTAMMDINGATKVLEFWELLQPVIHILSLPRQARRQKQLLERLSRHAPPLPDAILHNSTTWRYLKDTALQEHWLALGRQRPPECLIDENAPPPAPTPPPAPAPQAAQADLQPASPEPATQQPAAPEPAAAQPAEQPAAPQPAAADKPRSFAAIAKLAAAAGAAAAARAAGKADAAAAGVAAQPDKDAMQVDGPELPAAAAAADAAGEPQPAQPAQPPAGPQGSPAPVSAAARPASPEQAAPAAADGAADPEPAAAAPAAAEGPAGQAADVPAAAAAPEPEVPTMDALHTSLHKTLHFLAAEAGDIVAIVTKNDPWNDAGHNRIEQVAMDLLSDLAMCPTRLVSWERLADLYCTSCRFLLGGAAGELAPVQWHSAELSDLRERLTYYFGRAVRAAAVCIAAYQRQQEEEPQQTPEEREAAQARTRKLADMCYEVASVFLSRVQGCTPLGDCLPPVSKPPRDRTWVTWCCTAYILYERGFSYVNQSDWNYPLVMGKLPRKVRGPWADALERVRTGQEPLDIQPTTNGARAAAGEADPAAAAAGAAGAEQGAAPMDTDVTLMPPAAPVAPPEGPVMPIGGDSMVLADGGAGASTSVAWVDETLRCYALACSLCLRSGPHLDAWYRLHATRLNIVLKCSKQLQSLQQPPDNTQVPATTTTTAHNSPTGTTLRTAAVMLSSVARYVFSALPSDECREQLEGRLDAVMQRVDNGEGGTGVMGELLAVANVLIDDCCEAMQWCIDQFRSLTSGNHSFYRAHYQRAKVWAHRGDPTRAIDELRPVLGPSPLTSKLKGAFGIHAEMFQRDQVKNTKKRAQMKRRRRSSIAASSQSQDTGIIGDPTDLNNLILAACKPSYLEGVGDDEEEREHWAMLRRIVCLYLASNAAIGDINMIDQVAVFLQRDRAHKDAYWGAPLSDIKEAARGLCTACALVAGRALLAGDGGDAAGRGVLALTAIDAVFARIASVAAPQAGGAGGVDADAAMRDANDAGVDGAQQQQEQQPAKVLHAAAELYSANVIDKLPQAHSLQTAEDAARAPPVLALLKRAGLAIGDQSGGLTLMEGELGALTVMHVQALAREDKIDLLRALYLQLRRRVNIPKRQAANAVANLPSAVPALVASTAAGLLLTTATAVKAAVEQLVSAHRSERAQAAADAAAKAVEEAAGGDMDADIPAGATQRDPTQSPPPAGAGDAAGVQADAGADEPDEQPAATQAVANQRPKRQRKQAAWVIAAAADAAAAQPAAPAPAAAPAKAPARFAQEVQLLSAAITPITTYGKVPPWQLAAAVGCTGTDLLETRLVQIWSDLIQTIADVDADGAAWWAALQGVLARVRVRKAGDLGGVFDGMAERIQAAVDDPGTLGPIPAEQSAAEDEPPQDAAPANGGPPPVGKAARPGVQAAVPAGSPARQRRVPAVASPSRALVAAAAQPRAAAGTGYSVQAARANLQTVLALREQGVVDDKIVQTAQRVLREALQQEAAAAAALQAAPPAAAAPPATAQPAAAAPAANGAAAAATAGPASPQQATVRVLPQRKSGGPASPPKANGPLSGGASAAAAGQPLPAPAAAATAAVPPVGAQAAPAAGVLSQLQGAMQASFASAASLIAFVQQMGLASQLVKERKLQPHALQPLQQQLLAHASPEVRAQVQALQGQDQGAQLQRLLQLQFQQLLHTGGPAAVQQAAPAAVPMQVPAAAAAWPPPQPQQLGVPVASTHGNVIPPAAQHQTVAGGSAAAPPAAAAQGQPIAHAASANGGVIAVEQQQGETAAAAGAVAKGRANGLPEPGATQPLASGPTVQQQAADPAAAASQAEVPAEPAAAEAPAAAGGTAAGADIAAAVAAAANGPAAVAAGKKKPKGSQGAQSKRGSGKAGAADGLPPAVPAAAAVAATGLPVQGGEPPAAADNAQGGQQRRSARRAEKVAAQAAAAAAAAAPDVPPPQPEQPAADANPAQVATDPVDPAAAPPSAQAEASQVLQTEVMAAAASAAPALEANGPAQTAAAAAGAAGEKPVAAEDAPPLALAAVPADATSAGANGAQPKRRKGGKTTPAVAEPQAATAAVPAGAAAAAAAEQGAPVEAAEPSVIAEAPESPKAAVVKDAAAAATAAAEAGAGQPGPSSRSPEAAAPPPEPAALPRKGRKGASQGAQAVPQPSRRSARRSGSSTGASGSRSPPPSNGAAAGKAAPAAQPQQDGSPAGAGAGAKARSPAKRAGSREDGAANGSASPTGPGKAERVEQAAAGGGPKRRRKSPADTQQAATAAAGSDAPAPAPANEPAVAAPQAGIAAVAAVGQEEVAAAQQADDTAAPPATEPAAEPEPAQPASEQGAPSAAEPGPTQVVIEGAAQAKPAGKKRAMPVPDFENLRRSNRRKSSEEAQ